MSTNSPGLYADLAAALLWLGGMGLQERCKLPGLCGAKPQSQTHFIMHFVLENRNLVERRRRFDYFYATFAGSC